MNHNICTKTSVYDKGLIIIISAPSGAGKTTICKEILKSTRGKPKTVFSVSVTTRAPRRGEINGRDYFFITETQFKNMISKNELAEWAVVYNHYYGTPREFLENTIKKGKDILLDIDVQGGRKIRQTYPDGVFVFILPPSWSVLKQRLRSRAKDDEITMKTRLKNAKHEMSYINDYDYLVINDKLNSTVRQIRAIIQVEHAKISQNEEKIKKFKWNPTLFCP